MKRITRKLSMILIPILMLLPAATLVVPAYAACGKSEAAQQVLQGVGQTTTTPCNDSGVGNAISLAVQILSIVVGIAAVIAVILGGFKYITSGGDTNKVANAKNTLVYAIIGLAIAVLAQLLVHFVINQTKSVTFLRAAPALAVKSLSELDSA
jgi:uncharacterized membrane protein YuzA (DUF378 family)